MDEELKDAIECAVADVGQEGVVEALHRVSTCANCGAIMLRDVMKEDGETWVSLTSICCSCDCYKAMVFSQKHSDDKGGSA